MRPSGIEVVGDIPWGTHFCQFYDTSQDLIETLVPYFREGLAANEFCMWVTSEPLGVEQATAALRAEVPDLDHYITKGQIEILGYSQWYIRSGRFCADEVLVGWVDKLSAALNRGYEGLRLSGNTFWLEQAHWDNFTHYEQTVNDVIGRYRMLAICTYCLRKCRATEIVDVVTNHQFALIKRCGRWEIIESAQHKKTEAALRESEERFRLATLASNDGIWDCNIVAGTVWWNDTFEQLFGPPPFNTAKYWQWWSDRIHLEDRQRVFDSLKAALAGTTNQWISEYRFRGRDGELRYIFDRAYIARDAIGKAVRVLGAMLDLTERNQAEEAVLLERKKLENILDSMVDGVYIVSQSRDVEFVNPVIKKEAGPYAGKKCYQYLIGRDEPCPECKCDDIFAGKTVRWEWTDPKTGKIYDCIDTPMTNPDGSISKLRIMRDITDYKRAEKEIENLAKFPSENPFPVLRISQDGTILYSNSPGSTLLEKWQRRAGESTPSEWCILIKEVLKSGCHSVKEVKLHSRVISFVLAPVVASGYVNIYGRDITERQKAEQKLRKARDELEKKVQERTIELSRTVNALQLSEARLAEAQRIAHLGNWDWDIVKNELWWSDEIYRIFGTNPREFQATYEAFLSYVHPDDRDFVRQSVNEALYWQKPYSIDHRVICPDGTECIVHEQAEVTYDANQNPVKMMGTVQDVTKQKKAEEEIRHNQEQLRCLAAQLQLTEERERHQIASDLHDSVGQILAFVRREIGTLQRSAPERLATSLEEIANQLDQAVKQTRALSFDLSPSVLYDLGFEAAIEDLTEKFEKERKIQCHFHNSEEPKPLEGYVKILLYRSIRELLINVAKHAEAKTVMVSLTKVDNNVQVVVQDDGKGFDSSNLQHQMGKSGGFGIFSIRERSAHIGGRFEIQSSKGKGTKAILQVPLNKRYAKKED